MDGAMQAASGTMARTEIIELSDDDDVVDTGFGGASAPASATAGSSVPLAPSCSNVIEIKDESAPTSPSAHIDIKGDAAPSPSSAAALGIKDEHASLVAAKKPHMKNEPLLRPPAITDPIPEPAPANKVMIMGYDVEFPEGKKPFPAQLAVMNKVLLALKTGQHALLESPTGSGKTLALLCSSLTFQRKHVRELVKNLEEQRKIAADAHKAKKKQIEQQQQQREAEMYSRANGETGGGTISDATDGDGAARGAIRASGVNDDDDFASTQPSFDQFRFPAFAKSFAVDDGWISMESKKSQMKAGGSSGSDDLDDFDSQPDFQMRTKKKRALPASFAALRTTAGSGGNSDDSMESPPELKKLKSKRSLPDSFSAAVQSAAAGVNHEKFHSTSEDDKTTSSRVVPPKIFFCSRTHSQLAQVVEELKNSPASYLQSPDASNPFANELKMCVLGSKANFCVNTKVNRDPSQVDEKCRNLMDMNSCTFANKRRKTNDLKRVAPPVWDIEDMVALSKRHRECGFYHSRELLVDANIVFCPYNYILDPSIRAAVSISLKNAIVIFDEAHNVEDTCRSAASMELNSDVLAIAIKAFTNVIKHGNRPPTYHSLLKILNGLNRWLQSVNANASTILKPTGFEEESKVWPGVDALAMFAEYTGMTQDSFAQIKQDLAAVVQLEKELSSSYSNDELQPSSNGMQSEGGESLSQKDEDTKSSMLLGTMPLSTVQMVITVADYMFRDQLKYLDDFKLIVRKSRNPRNAGGRFRGSYTADAKSNGWELKMCIWCLNAAVAFSDVVQQARSVILTSGTLSPMDSFAGELGTDFPIRLEANHVVNMRKQVFAGAIMHGPGGVDLSSTYNNQQAFQYQDSMGHLLLQYAQVIPGGILMFFPSYTLMDKLETRWRQTGIWDQIDAIKTMYSEPRKAGKDFDKLLDEYKYAVASGRAGTAGTKTGAVFIAVYRGKVSEGIDFSNDNARAVLAVGIPFPSVKELQVSLKRQYQDEKSRVDKKLVSGHVWYQLQAFRALNQALGRCIRHRNDYGTILLLDSRHRGQKHTASLSKWMRPFLQEVEHSEQCLSHFLDFFKRNEVELGTGAAKEAIKMEAKRGSNGPVVLGYETSSSSKMKSKMAAPQAPSSTLQSTMTSVKAYMEKKQLEREGPRVFSLFKQSKEPKSETKAASNTKKPNTYTRRK